MSARKCGRIRPSASAKRAVPHLRDYLTAPLPLGDAPPTCDNVTGAAISMGGNDEVGDCTIAGQANWFAICALKLGLAITIVADALKSVYFSLTGGQDTGLNELLVLTKVKAQGLDVGDGVVRRNALFVRIDMRNHALVRYCIWKFWAIYLGAELPDFALSSDVWNGPSNLQGENAPKQENGHCFLVAAYGETQPDGRIPVKYTTWGTNFDGDLDFADDYVDEGYIQIDEERAAEIGLDWDRLLADANGAAA